MDALLEIGLIFFLFFIVYAANQVQAGTGSPANVKSMLYVVVGMLFTSTFFFVSTAFAPTIVTTEASLLVAGVSATAGILCLQIIRSYRLRKFIERMANARFNPGSIVHVTAAVLVITVFSSVIMNFILIGGLQGIAENIEQQGDVSSYELIFQAVVMIAAAFLGVGYAIRRDGQQTLDRLGLRPPQGVDLRVGIGMGVLLFISSRVFLVIWLMLVSPETFMEQTQAADQFARSINTLGLALLISITASVGEEIFMRGALQPVFGIAISSLLFALLHSQYLLTPTTFLILFVAVGLGWIRQRYSTTAAIIGHFIYNFIPLVLLVLTAGSPPTP